MTIRDELQEHVLGAIDAATTLVVLCARYDAQHPSDNPRRCASAAHQILVRDLLALSNASSREGVYDASIGALANAIRLASLIDERPDLRGATKHLASLGRCISSAFRLSLRRSSEAGLIFRSVEAAESLDFHARSFARRFVLRTRAL